VKTRVGQLHEMNPMLGHRGCRLAVTYPEILETQVQAITEAVIACREKKIDAQAEIMIPLAGMAEDAEFFSFGTNDLTQMTFGFSRDDINTFLPDYLRLELLPRDPFQSIDVAGVGQLVEMGVKKGRSARKDLKCGICGEHGGDPDSIQFCQKVGLDYVSCSPFRVPIARLAAAQAALKQSGTDIGRKGE
jgi:pyruvate, orthophosphate dikinase